MRIIHRYIIKEFLTAFFLAFFIMTLVMALGNIVRFVELIITKGVPTVIIIQLLAYTIPYLLPYIIPISIMAGLLLSLGRLSSDNEIIAIRASGMHMKKIILPFIVLGIIFSLFSVIINYQIIPHAHFKVREIMYKIGKENPTASLEAGTFNSFGKFIIFVYHIDGNKFRHIRIYEPQEEGKPPRTIIAKRGEFISLPDENILKLKLIDGTFDEINPSNPNTYYKVNFHVNYKTIMFNGGGNTKKIGKKSKDMTYRELKDRIKELRKQQINDDPVSTELHSKLALSFSSLVFFLLGAPLGVITRRREKSANITLAIIIVGIYFILSLAVKGLCIEGNLAPSSGTWIPNIIFAIIAIFLNIKLCVF